jgi:hypothetical protein
MTKRMTNEEMKGDWESIAVRIADSGNGGVTRLEMKNPLSSMNACDGRGKKFQAFGRTLLPR